MKKILALSLLGAALLCAESPNISGVWQADLQKSKIPGPPLKAYLVIIEQKMAIFDRRTKEQAPQIVETTGTWGEHDDRSVLTVFDNGKPAISAYQGVPTRFTASFQGNTLTVNGEVAGHASTLTRIYQLSPDGQTITLNTTATNEGHPPMQSTIVLTKQPDSAGDPLRKPEEVAETHFKNVKTASLKVLPASEFIDQMRYFSWSLGKNCEFCHVAHKFDSDDKKEKKTARKMIDMAAAIDENHFEGHPAVRCFTCHEGHAHPLQYPQFADQIAAEKAEAEKAAQQHP